MWPLTALASVFWSLVLLEGKLEAEVATDPVLRAMLNEGPFSSDLQIIAQALGHKLALIPLENFGLAGLAALVAYLALAWYDRIALQHLGRREGIPRLFSGLSAFVAYALAHNIGASVLSGGAVRYRAYHSQGLSRGEVAGLIGFCSLTFALGAMLLLGLVLVCAPGILSPLDALLPAGLATQALARGTGLLLLGACLLCVGASFLTLKPLVLGRWTLRYPAPRVVCQQLLAGPLEILGAAAILHFALPGAGHPGFVIVLGGFLIAFCMGLLTQVPGGMGVMEAVFLALMPGMPPSEVLAALLVWRLFYLLIPLALSAPIILEFERRAWRAQRR